MGYNFNSHQVDPDKIADINFWMFQQNMLIKYLQSSNHFPFQSMESIPYYLVSPIPSNLNNTLISSLYCFGKAS